jgi:hypothetical protein
MTGRRVDHMFWFYVFLAALALSVFWADRTIRRHGGTTDLDRAANQVRTARRVAIDREHPRRTRRTRDTG